MSQFTTDRRTIVKGAAWTIPAVSVAAAAPSLAASPTCEPTYQDITKTFVYSALGIADITVEVTAKNVPLTAPAGASLQPIETSSKVTIPANIAGLLRQLYLPGAVEVDGTSVSVSTLSGAYPGEATTNLTIDRTPFPASGDLVTVATGTGEQSSVPDDASTGLVTITMGEPNSTLNGYTEDGSAVGPYESNLAKKDGNDYVLATFNVVEC